MLRQGPRTLRVTARAGLACGLLLGLVTSATPLRAQEAEPNDALRRPERLTVGVSDQFLGQLAPDQKTLYFVSNRNTRSEIFAQDVEEGRARAVFDEGADVTWPRVSPDGKALLYVSYSDQATGQLCVRDLPGGSGRRCLTDTAAALQAEWIDSGHIALVGRASIQGDLRVSEVTVAGRLSSRPRFDRNLTSLAVSPDGRWLVYVPLDRVVDRVGPAFAARAGQRLEALRLDRDGPPVPLSLDLPGMTGQPAFARDGRSLYVVQFLTDSNHDGVIDAGDHGVLFRVPFPSGEDDAPARAAAATPLQLTDGSWNCQYPAPAAARVITTCSREDALELYELPLDGEVPADWTAERLRLELELGSHLEEKLLLYRHRLARETRVTTRGLIMMRLVLVHLELDEFRAAEFYARHLAALPDPATAGLSGPLLVLIDHRRSRRARERGRAVDTFAADARRQMAELGDAPADSPATLTLKHLARSEIADATGDKSRAKQELDAAAIDDATPRPVIDAYVERADALYRELDDREALVAVRRRFATSEAIAKDQQLEHARAAARALTRGLPFDEADALLARERAVTPGDHELGFALDLARATLAIRDASPPEPVRQRLIALYTAQTRTDRKRAIVLDALQRAADMGADRVLEALSERYLDDVPPGTQEHRRAERLYTEVILGRAFRRRAAGHTAEARADFDAVVRRTGSFEAVVESIVLRLRAGERPAAVQASFDAQGEGPGSPRARFVRAYLLSRKLGDLRGEEHAKAVAEARAELRAAWSALKTKPAVRALYGAIMHEDYLRTGELAAAEAANAHYMVALELSRRDPRYRAMILGQLGVLHTTVGNYRIALGYLEEREKLPYTDGAVSLAVRLTTARALLHVGREKDAATMADKALSMVDGTPALAPYRALALDRAALYNLAADRFARALALYDLEVPLLGPAADPAATRSRVVVRLARAAAAIGAGEPGRALEDLAAIDPSLDDPGVALALASPHVTPAQAGRSYRSIAAGLRANADLALGRRGEAAVALERRRALFMERLASSDRDEDVRALTLVETRLADNAGEQRDFPAAARWLGLALDHADRLLDRTHAAVDADQLHALWLGAEIHTTSHAPMSFDVQKRLGDAQGKMVAQHDASYRTYERWFEIYLALTAPPSPGTPPAPAP